MNSSEYINLEDEYGAHNYHPLDVILCRGEGAWVYDVDGNRYLDCLSAYSALNQGHCHPRILNTFIDQAQKITLTSRAFRNDQLPLLYQELSEITGYEMSLPMNTGSEAVETALKISRKWAYRVKNIPRYKAEIITAKGNFHGRTIAIISTSTEALYREDFGPYTPGFVSVPYGNVEAIKDAITPYTTAVMIEPIQGENGVIIPPDGYLREVFDICKQNNVLFIADEIQTGLGRTGELFACDHEKIKPDIMVIGKAVSGGFYPVSFVLSSKEILGLFRAGEHGSTFGGNPLAAAVTRTALKVLIEEDLIGNSQRMGEYFIGKLNQISSKHIKEIRGRGLFLGIELFPEAGGARRFCEKLKEKGILAKETHKNTIRLAPPLIIKKDTLDWAVPIIETVLAMD